MKKKDFGKTTLGMEANVAALLSYLAFFITGIIFYILEKDNKLVRFHAMQSIVVFGFLWALIIIAPFFPFMGSLISNVAFIAVFISWIIAMVKAYRGEFFKFPIAGDIAEKNL